MRRLPEWVENVPPLEDTLKIPTGDGDIIRRKEDPKAHNGLRRFDHPTLDSAYLFCRTGLAQ